MKSLAFIVLATLPVWAALAQHAEHQAERQVLAPGYSALQFLPPEPGSYTLPPLGRAAEGQLLDSTGARTTLHALYDDKTVVLSFIYTSCPDVNGCPLATFVLSQIQQQLASDERLRKEVRLISVSFDPINDSPAVMGAYGKAFKDKGVDWRFLTAESEQYLNPILDDYDQSVIRDIGPDGEPTGTMSHILRVFLIDDHKRIRNIYSPSFLHPDVLLADIQTIADE